MTETQINALPRELRELKQWTFWKVWKKPDGKITKPPCDKGGYSHDCTQAKNLLSFEPALKTFLSVKEKGKVSGIGFAFNENGISGIDIDHCIDAAGNLTEEARKIIDRVDSYTEISPSKTGIHILVKGTIPESERSEGGGYLGGKRGAFEAYSSGRYFTMTGNVFEGKAKIEDRQNELVWFWKTFVKSKPKDETPSRGQQTLTQSSGPLSDDDILKIISKAKNSAKIQDLMNSGGDSEGDAALINCFMFYSKDTAQIERLMRSTSRSREKWDKIRGKDNFLAYEIKRLLKNYQGGSYEPKNIPQKENSITGVPPVDAKKPTESQGKKPNDSEILINTLFNSLEFFKNDGEVWITVEISGIKQNMPVRSSGFKKWIRTKSFEILGKHIGTETVQKVSENLDAIATNSSSVPEKQIFVRLGNLNGKIYFDLANDQWQVVEIDDTGWRIVKNPPVKFRRAQGMKPLPVPVVGGKIEDLRPLINAFNDDTWVLSIAWIIGALHPTGPYPILIFQGEQGTAKTTMSMLMRDLIDPSKASLRTVPREDKDILIAANNGLVVAFDNLSGIPDWLSDLFCRISTGGGFSTRQLYTDYEEVIINVKRPQILNGIDDVAHRGDLRDRALILNLDPIPDTKRREETDILKDYELLRPGIMGAIFTAVSTALQNRAKTKIKNLPRMADFAAWIVAAESSLPWKSGQFLKVYNDTAHTAIEAALEGSPVAGAIRKILDKRSVWTGHMSELLEEMNGVVSDTIKLSKSWPKDSTRLSKALRRISTEFRRVGIEVMMSRDKTGSNVILKKVTLTEATGKGLHYDEESEESGGNPEEPLPKVLVL